VDVLLVEEPDVLCRAVVAGEELDVVLLEADRLVLHPGVGAGDPLAEEGGPFGVAEPYAVEPFELPPHVVDEVGF